MLNDISIKEKLFLLFVFTISFAVGVVAWIGFTNAKEAKVKAIYEQFSNEIAQVSNQIEGMLATVPDNLKYNKNLYSLHRFLIWKDLQEQYKTREWMDAYLNNIKEYLRSSKHYYGVRLIDDNAKEIFFLRYYPKTNRVEVKKTHQNRSDKEYFNQAINLPENAFYVSRFDLSKVGNIIERPFRPVVRFSAPIINKNKDRLGVIVLNFDGKAIIRYLQDIQAKANIKSQRFYLLNKDGYYLYNSDETKMWGFERENDFNFKNDYPGIFKVLTTKDQATFEKNGYIISVRKVYPNVKNAPQRFWYLVTVVEKSEAFASLYSFMNIFLLALSFIVAFDLFLINRYISKVTKPLEKVNRQLSALAKGEIIKENIKYKSHDEVGQIVRSTQVVVDSTELMIHQAKAVANGEFDEDIRLLGANDWLGQALKEMLLRLKEITTIAQKIARGNYDIHVNAKGSADKLGFALIDMVEYLKNVTQVAESIESGMIDINYKVKEDEDRLGMAMMRMIEYLKSIRDHANAISNNDFSKTINVKSKNDELGRALAKMTRLLKENYIKNKRDIWLSEGTSMFSDALTGENDIIQLAKDAITIICRYIGAASGVVYNVSKEHKELQLVASFAYTKRGTIANKIEFGEGIVGQVALEKEPILLSKVTDEIKVISGTTVATPKEVYAFPLVFEGELYGVVEVASFEKIDDLKREYLNKISTIFATYLRAAYQNEKIKTLLKESQRAYEELQKQSQKLQATNDELEEKQKQLALQAKELQKKNDELQRAKEDIDKKAQELAKSSKYKSEFLANMSHELRTPLNSIILLSKLLAQNESGVLSEDEIKKAQVIHSAGNDLLHLINDILDLSKIESGRMDLLYEQFDSVEIVDELKGLFDEVAKQKNLQFEVVDRCKSTCVTDKMKLMQILKNLLSNAFKFTKTGSVKVEMEKEGQKAIFRVIDTGIGIPNEKRDAIFEAFRQVDGSITREYGGTGLGLSITKKFVELMGGEIQVQSQEGKGSKFVVVIPMKEASKASLNEAPKQIQTAKTTKPAAENKILQIQKNKEDELIKKSTEKFDNVDLKGKNILIVDDDSKNIFVLSGLLQDYNAETFSALNGKEALDVLQEEKIDAILLDLMMPDIDGITLLKELNQNKKLNNISVIVITVIDDEKTKQELFELGVKNYFTKPIDVDELLKALT